MARPSITQLPPTGLDRFRGLLTRADDLTGGLLAAVPGIGTLAALNRSGNEAQAGNYTKAVESLTDVVPVGRLATRAIKGLTKGRSTGDVGGVMNIRAPQQDALDLAQKRAALPVSEGGLGLPPDNTPMDRARAMGFDVDNPLYHGTDKSFEAFDLSKLGSQTRIPLGFPQGIYTSPDASVAGRYGSQDGANVLKLLARSSNAQTPNVDGTPREVFDRFNAGNIDAVKSNSVTVLKDPSQLRSMFAAFDPFRRNEADLLAIQGATGSSGLDSSNLNRYETDADRRMEIARRNAALPVEQGGLGLPADNTPMDRARAMGFDLNNPLYHGTNKDITAFNPNAGEAAREMTGTNLSSSPEIANSYAGRPDGNVIPVLVNAKGFDSVDFEGNNWNNLPEDALLRQRNGDEQVSDFFDEPYGLTTNDVGRLSRRLGAPGISINDVSDRGGYVRGVGNVPPSADNMMVFDPSRIRSRFAAFDPMRRNEADLLAFRGNMASSNLLNINPLLGLLDYENQ